MLGPNQQFSFPGSNLLNNNTTGANGAKVAGGQ